MSNPDTRKSCIVPMCLNTTTNAPEKLFFIVPFEPKSRKKWMEVTNRADPPGDKSCVYCCEDHFDVESDMENYVKYKLVGGRIKLKKGVVPHKFECQKPITVKPERSAVQKRNQKPENLFCEEVELPSDSSDLWNYFEKEYGNRARCILCLRIFSRSVGVLKDHLAQKHQKKSENEESDTEFGRDDDQNCYTEIVYLEDEEPKPEPISKPIIIQKRPEPKKRKVPSYEPEETYNEEVENFGKYVTSLLKKLPKDLCTQLQMDIVNLIMKAKLNNMAAKMAPNVTSVGGNTSFMVTLPNVSNSNESITVINNVKNSLDPL